MRREVESLQAAWLQPWGRAGGGERELNAIPLLPHIYLLSTPNLALLSQTSSQEWIVSKGVRNYTLHIDLQMTVRRTKSYNVRSECKDQGAQMNDVFI